MLSQLKRVFKSLENHKVRYVVIGGIAAVLHGVPRATFDLDILVEPTQTNAEALLKALEEAGLGTASLIEATQLLGNQITTFDDYVRIDVMTSTPGLAFTDAWDRKIVARFEGEAVYLASREHLLASKRASARQQDLEDVRILELSDSQESSQ